MIAKSYHEHIRWMLVAFAVTGVMITLNFGSGFLTQGSPADTFLGVNLFLEILVFFAFNIFVVFGIKGFFERYTKQFCNSLILVSGSVLFMVLIFLGYEILFNN